MATSFKDRIGIAVTGSPGTGTISLGTPLNGSQGFSSSDDGKTFDCIFEDGTSWETALDCTYTYSTNSLTRGTLSSSSTGSRINLSSATVVKHGPIAARASQMLVPTGTIISYQATSSDPSWTLNGFLPCDGTSVPRSSYPALSSISADGMTWTTVYTNTACPQVISTIGNTSTYMAVVGNASYNNNTGVIITSSDNGLTWSVSPANTGTSNYVCTSATTTPTNTTFVYNNNCSYVSFMYNKYSVSTKYFQSTSWNCILWNGSQYVLANTWGNTYTSPDGLVWTSRSNPCTTNSIAWNGSWFCAVGNLSPPVAVSQDGINWTSKSPSVVGLTKVIAVGTTFYAAGTGYIYISTDNGNTWNSYTSPGSAVNDMVYFNSKIVALTTSGVFTSPDGINWSSVAALGNTIFFKAATNGTSLVIATQTATVGGWRQTTDLVNWASANAPCYLWGSKVVWNGTSYMATGPYAYASFSSDGLNWQSYPVTYGNLSAVDVLYWTGTQYIIAQSGQTKSATSTDGITWTNSPALPVSGYWSCIVKNNSNLLLMFSAGGYNSYLSSTDGVNWTQRTLPINMAVYGAAWTGSRFCIIQDNIILTSTDGLNWTTTTLPYNLSNYIWNSGASNGSVTCFLSNKYVVYSIDGGATWTLNTLPTTSGNWMGLIWTGTMFIATSDSRVITSTDGINWVTRTTPINIGSFNSVAGYNNTVVLLYTTTNPQAGVSSITGVLNSNTLQLPYIATTAFSKSYIKAT